MPVSEKADLDDALDGELADLLEQLDSADEEGDWMAEIQQGSLELGAKKTSRSIISTTSTASGSRRAKTRNLPARPGCRRRCARRSIRTTALRLDLFSDDEQLQNLLNRTSDTEPIHLSDIEDWLNTEQEQEAGETEERYLDIEDELLHSPPSRSWLEDIDGDESSIGTAAENDS